MESRKPITHLIDRRSSFRAYLVSRLGNATDADDVLQAGLLKALRATPVGDEEKITAWFYRVLHNALVDHVRSRSARERRENQWTTDGEGQTEVSKRSVCACVEALLEDLRPRAAELVRRVELGGEPVATVAKGMGLSAGAASVALHRARADLRRRLEDFCGECARGACLDCDCAERAE
jgi:RNA polymerase sigma-70 factor (ECF subfamily)